MLSLAPDNEHLKNLALRVEANNPNQSTDWRFLFEFGEDQYIACQELIDELNIINAPIQLRIVSNTNIR
jgi:hypothetical protein